jgi:hypothetical protein
MRKRILYFTISALVAAALFMAGCEQTAGTNNGNSTSPVEIPAVPEKPELISGDSFLGVVWKKVVGAESYSVYYGESGDINKAQKWDGELTEEAETYSTLITGLDNGERYYVWVSASNASGESGYSDRAYEKPAASSFELPPLFFDYGRMIASYDNTDSVGTYTVPLGRTLVLTPAAAWKISAAAVYEWKVDDVVQSGPAVYGNGGEYFSFAPSAQKAYIVNVKITDGETVAEAVTEVSCVAAEGNYKREKRGASEAKARTCFGFMPAPGQFSLPPVGWSESVTAENITQTAQQYVGGTGVTWHFSLGAFGGYVITGFDHSVDNVPGEYSFSIKGNAFGTWGEPGVVWVSQDENGNGQADDTWYELKGSQTSQAGTIQRYAVTWFKPPQSTGISCIWKDNQGNTGTYPKGFRYLKDMKYFTLVGTKIGSGSDGWGYVDIVGPERFRISDAMQVDGSPVNLAYIDFVKVQCGSHDMAGIFGEISTETGEPYDLSIPNPALLIQGMAAGGGQYSYRFVNTSGYALTVTVEGQTFGLSTSGGEKTITLDKAEVYFDYYGGNVTFTRATGLVTFSM